MLIEVLKSKISYATMTNKELFYVGSITIDADIMIRANIRENEKVQVVNLNNGERLETYVITGKAQSKIIALNGPAARKAEIGDDLFIMAYGFVDDQQMGVVVPALVDLHEV
jgi:aspartate 1-decarboxylase